MADLISSRIVSTIASTLKQHVKPSLDTNETLIHMDMALQMLQAVETRLTSLDANLFELLKKEQNLLGDIGQLLGSTGDIEAKGRLDAVAADNPIKADDAIAVLEKARQAFESAIADAIPALFGLQPNAEADNCLTAIVDMQREFIYAQDPEINRGIQAAYSRGRVDDEESKAPTADSMALTDESLTRYLQKKFPDTDGVAAQDVYVVPGGYSKMTVLFTLSRPGVDDQQLAIRKDLPVSPIETTVVDEFPLLQKVCAAGFPVAEPVWLETDTKFFDGAFMVSARANGINDISGWQQEPTAADAFTKELARVMADLHELDLVDLGFPPEVTEKSAGEYTLAEIDRYFGYYKDHSLQPHPLLDFAYGWMRQNVPAHLFDEPPRLVHADIGFHNMLTDNGKITAVLDWEMSHLGDPNEDVFYSKPFIEQVADWTRFMEYYQSFGGQPIHDESQNFYSVWMSARNAAGCTRFRDFYETDFPDEIKMALAGYVMGRRLEIDASSRITGGGGI